MFYYYINPNQQFFIKNNYPECLYLNSECISKNGNIVKVKECVELQLDCILIKPYRSTPFYIPKNALLKVKSSGIGDYKYNDEIFVSPNEYSISYIRHKLKLFRTVIPIETKKLFIPPYIIGVWLTKGNRTFISCKNNFILDRLLNEVKKVDGLILEPYTFKYESVTYTHRFNSVFYDWCKLNNTHKTTPICPKEYIFSDQQQRTELLEGILDSIGHLKKQCNTYDLTLRDKTLTTIIQTIASSLGFYVNIKEKLIISSKKAKDGKKYIFRIYISVDPCLINCANPIKNYIREPFPLHSIKTGFKIEEIKEKQTILRLKFDEDPEYLFDKYGIAIGMKAINL